MQELLLAVVVVHELTCIREQDSALGLGGLKQIKNPRISSYRRVDGASENGNLSILNKIDACYMTSRT